MNLLSIEKTDNYKYWINILVLKNLFKDYNEEQLIEIWHIFSVKSIKYN